jgi:hypothetical protein
LTHEPVYATVPRILPNGGTVLVLGSGPSLTQADVTLAAAHVEAVIAVNDSYKLIPDATCLYAADPHWWKWHHGAREHTMPNKGRYPAFTGRFRYTLTSHAGTYAAHGVEVLKRGPETGLSLDPTRVALGRNGVYQAINIACHFGATRILLLGVDMHGGHFFGSHPNNSGPPFSICLERFKTLIDPLKQAGITLINCSRQTALKCFPRVPLEEALCARLSQAS